LRWTAQRIRVQNDVSRRISSIRALLRPCLASAHRTPATSPTLERTLRGALAGIVAAAVWAGAEPLLGRLLRTPYSDRRLLAGLTGRSPAAALAFHFGNGAIFGACFERLGGRGPLQGVLAAQVENIVLWPAMAVVDRIHPDRRSGAWPPLLRNERVFAYEVAAHALFGAALGLLLPQKPGE
jgi:hypothetical protein